MPDAEIATIDGSTTDGRDLGVYVHVPFCSVRCGYCDFNTYTADELGEGATRATWCGCWPPSTTRSASSTGPR